MNKIALSLLIVLSSLKCMAQTNTYFSPFQGFKVLENGLTCGGIRSFVDEEQWVSNKISLAKNAKIKILKPRGFELNNDSTAFFGLSALLMSPKGDTLLYSPNIFGEITEGYNVNLISNLSVTLQMKTLKDKLSIGDVTTIKIVCFDVKSTRNIVIEGKIIVVSENEIPSADSYYNYTVGTDYRWSSAGVDCTEMKFFVDLSLGDTQATVFRTRFNTKGLSKIDLDNSTIEIQMLYKDGSIKTQENIKDIKRLVNKVTDTECTTMILFPVSDKAMSDVHSVWIRLTDKSKKWIVAGSVKL